MTEKKKINRQKKRSEGKDKNQHAARKEGNQRAKIEKEIGKLRLI